MLVVAFAAFGGSETTQRRRNSIDDRPRLVGPSRRERRELDAGEVHVAVVEQVHTSHVRKRIAERGACSRGEPAGKVAKRAGQDMGRGIATEPILTVHRSTFRAQRRLDGDRDHDDVGQVAVSLVDAVGDRVAVKVYQLAAETNVELVRPPGPCRLAQPSPRSGSRSPGCQLRELELQVLTAATEGYAREGNDNGGRRDRDVRSFPLINRLNEPVRAAALVPATSVAMLLS